jgi:hypothetical protein
MVGWPAQGSSAQVRKRTRPNSSTVFGTACMAFVRMCACY